MNSFYDASEVDENKRHYFFNRSPLFVHDVVSRLSRKIEIYKSFLYLNRRSVDPNDTRDPEIIEAERYKQLRLYMYNNLFQVDYNTVEKQTDKECCERHMIDMPFTFLHW